MRECVASRNVAVRALHHARHDRGFTLAEVLVAAAFVTIAFAAIGTGFLQGTGSVEIGRQQTTAIYLGEQRLEQIKAWSLSSTQGFSSVATGAACCADEAYNSIANYSRYRRAVTVTVSGTNNKVIQVSVFYFPVNPAAGNAGNERRVDVSTLVTNR